jgi:DNA-binding Lrp family transcriptional regulator
LEITGRKSNGFIEEFCIFSEANHSIKFAVAKNMTEFERHFGEFIRKYENNAFLDRDGVTTIRFPYELTKFHSYFDFAPLLRRVFELDPEEGAKDDHPPYLEEDFQVINTDLSDLEKRIYYALVENPEESDGAVAKIVKCSRQSVTKAKERFYSEDLIRRKRLVNLEKLGFEILAIIHSKTNPRQMKKEREGIEFVSRTKTPILHLTKNFESVTIVAFKDFKEYHELHELTTNYMAKNNFIIGEPNRILLSIPRMTILKSHFYGPIVKNVLNI